MVDHVLPSHISMIDSIHGFKNPSQENFCLWFRIVGGEGSRLHTFSRFWRASLLICILKRILDPKRVLAALFFAWNSSMNQCIFGQLGGGAVNIFLPVFKSLKFSLQYEILNLEVFLQINGANYALVVDNTNFHFQTSLNQFWIPVKATCFFMVQNHWYVQ